MLKTINAMRARVTSGKFFEEVYYRGDQYVIERVGKPMAVVVPVEQFEQWRKEREEFFSLVDEIRERNREANPEALAGDVAAVVRAVRKRR